MVYDFEIWCVPLNMLFHRNQNKYVWQIAFSKWHENRFDWNSNSIHTSDILWMNYFSMIFTTDILSPSEHRKKWTRKTSHRVARRHTTHLIAVLVSKIQKNPHLNFGQTLWLVANAMNSFPKSISSSGSSCCYHSNEWPIVWDHITMICDDFFIKQLFLVGFSLYVTLERRSMCVATKKKQNLFSFLNHS